MTDETPQNPRAGLPPVRMALRVIGRHGHRGGPHLARAVAGARAPKHLGASTRLARRTAPAAGAPAAPTAPPRAPPPPRLGPPQPLRPRPRRPHPPTRCPTIRR